MKRNIIITAFLFIALLASTAFAAEFVLKSPQLQEGGQLSADEVFSGFGCTGKNISPALSWEGAPANTKSFAVTVYDPDAPTGSGWWHWLIFNIPADVTGLAQNAGDPASGLAPKGCVQSRTDFDKLGYGGACPPAGDKPHRYIFTVYALDIEQLALDENASAAMVGFNLNQHTIAKSTITVYYSR